MKRSLVFGMLALTILFFKLPGISCQTCNTVDPYLPMLAISYFAAFLACILCFPSLPSPHFKYTGMIWSIGLAISLTYLNPIWCLICLIAHACHIGMWIFWKPRASGKVKKVAVKSSFILLSMLSFPLFFYGMQKKNDPLVKAGSIIKPFAQSDYKGMIINFVSPNCAYCKEQIATLNKTAKEFHDQGFRFVNVTRHMSDDLQGFGPDFEWIEDQENNLAPLFGIAAYPTTVLLDSKGVVIKTAVGAPIDFRKDLETFPN